MEEMNQGTAQTQNDAAAVEASGTATATAEANADNQQQAESGQQTAGDGTAGGTNGEQETPAEATTETPAETPAETTTEETSYTLTAPEGLKLDEQTLSTYTETAREAGLTQDAAQKVLDTVVPKLAERQMEEVQRVIGQLKQESEKAGFAMVNDKPSEALALAIKGMKTFDGEGKLAKLLTDTGMGNHPVVLGFMRDVGRALGEDRVVTGRHPASTAEPLDAMFPTSKGV